MQSKEVYSVKDLATYLGLCETKIRQLIKRNEIPFVKIDGQYKFFMPVVRQWLADASTTASAGTGHEQTEKITDVADNIWTKSTEK